MAEKKGLKFVGEKLFDLDKTKLIASKCKNCSEVVFPKQAGCPSCCKYDVEEVLIGPKGKLHCFTNVNYPVPGGYNGPIPYGVGIIDLPEGARITSLLTEYDPAKLKVGMPMEMVIEELYDSESGETIVGFRFKPE